MKNTRNQSKFHALIILAILVALFAIPFFVAWLVFKNNMMQGGVTNHGLLLNPPAEMTAFQIYNDHNQLLDNQITSHYIAPSATRTSGKWLLLAVQNGACDLTCEKSLYALRQVRLATGKNMDRVERALLVFSTKKDNRLQTLLSQPFSGTILLHTDFPNFQSKMLKTTKATYAAQNGTIYIVDPFGNMMMVYSPSMKPDDIFKDLEHLLNASQIG